MALATNALTTLAKVQADLGISTDISDLVNAASDAIEKYCNRSFYKAEVSSEGVAGYGAMELLVARTPIDTSEDITITYDGGSVASDGYEVLDADAGIIRNKWNAWHWTAANVMGAEWRGVGGTERHMYAVSYTGGYVTPAQADEGDPYDTRTLPYDLELACRKLVAAYYHALGADPRVTSEKLMSAAVTYAAPTASGLPPQVEAMLSPYRRLVI